MLLVKLIVLLLLGFVIISLFSGLYFLVKDKGQTNRTVNALSIRIGLSILAIVIVMIAGATGVIDFNPSPLSAGRPAQVTNDSPATGQSTRPSISSGGRTRIEP
jgi:hypothetical protein